MVNSSEEAVAEVVGLVALVEFVAGVVEVVPLFALSLGVFCLLLSFSPTVGFVLVDEEFELALALISDKIDPTGLGERRTSRRKIVILYSPSDSCVCFEFLRRWLQSVG